MAYDNTDRGVLFKNDRKEKDSHPDYRGNINVGGTEYWLSAWIKEGPKGKYMSLSVSPKEDRKKAASKPNDYERARAGQHTGSLSDMDDDIPPF